MIKKQQLQKATSSDFALSLSLYYRLQELNIQVTLLSDFFVQSNKPLGCGQQLKNLMTGQYSCRT